MTLEENRFAHMKSRFHFYIFVVALTLIGVIFQQQDTAPNQEIVLQFTDVEVTSIEAKHAVISVTEQLQGLGVEAVQISEQEDGKLIISYYSDVDVLHVKTILSKEKNIVLGLNSSNQNEDNSQFPTQKQSITYNLDVYEIQSYNDIESNLNGSVVDLHSFSDQLLNPNLYSSHLAIDGSERGKQENVAYRVYKNIAIAINNIPYVIPEVRAGPYANLNS